MARARPCDKSLLDAPDFNNSSLPLSGPLLEGWIENVTEWHQAVGLTALLESVFSPVPKRSIAHLIADEVGVGKTLQAFLFIGMLTLAVEMAQQQKALPPLLGECLQDLQFQQAVLTHHAITARDSHLPLNL